MDCSSGRYTASGASTIVLFLITGICEIRSTGIKRVNAYIKYVCLHRRYGANASYLGLDGGKGNKNIEITQESEDFFTLKRLYRFFKHVLPL